MRCRFLGKRCWGGAARYGKGLGVWRRRGLAVGEVGWEKAGAWREWAG